VDDAAKILKAGLSGPKRKKTMADKAGWPTGRRHSAETKAKIAEAMRGKTPSAATRNKIGKANRANWKRLKQAAALLEARGSAA
jgi:hypothetical protein